MKFLDKVLILDNTSDQEISGKLKSVNNDTILVKLDSKIDCINSWVHVVLNHETMGNMLYEAHVKSFNENQVWLNKLEIIEVIQKRDETRVPYDVSLLIQKIINNNQPITLDKKLIMRSVDMSANGIKLCCNLELPLNVQLFFDLPINNELIPCFAEIVRRELKDSDYYYGCILTIPENKKDKIRKFVFKTQIEIRNKEKKNNLQVLL